MFIVGVIPTTNIFVSLNHHGLCQNQGRKEVEKGKEQGELCVNHTLWLLSVSALLLAPPGLD